MGLLAARNLMGETHNLFDVNCDTEYQEKARITATGLAYDEGSTESPKGVPQTVQ